MTRPIETVSRLWTVWSKAGGPVPGAVGVEYETAARITAARKADGTGHAKERPVRCRAALSLTDAGTIDAAILIYPKR